MTVDPLAIVALALVIAAVPSALMLGRRLARADRALTIAAVVCVGFIGLWFYAEEYSDLGLRVVRWDDFVYLERIPLYFAILMLIGLCLPRLGQSTRRGVGVVTVLFSLYAVAEVGAPAALPLYAGQLSADTTGPDEVTQSTGWSCGAAALAWAARLKGVPASERQMAGLAVIAPLRGAKLRGLVRALHSVGLAAEAKRRARWEELLAAPKPALVGWKLSATVGHVVVVIEASASSVTVGDPLLGQMDYSGHEFLQSWDRDLVVIQ